MGVTVDANGDPLPQVEKPPVVPDSSRSRSRSSRPTAKSRSGRTTARSRKNAGESDFLLLPLLILFGTNKSHSYEASPAESSKAPTIAEEDEVDRSFRLKVLKDEGNQLICSNTCSH